MIAREVKLDRYNFQVGGRGNKGTRKNTVSCYEDSTPTRTSVFAIQCELMGKNLSVVNVASHVSVMHMTS